MKLEITMVRNSHMSTTGDHSREKYGLGGEALFYFVVKACNAEAPLPPDENITVT